MAGAFTPVPGGVGPLTIAMLMVNTIQAAERHLVMIRAGLTGGLACGKSFVGRVFEELGCHVVRADDARASRCCMPGGEAYRRRRRRCSGRRFWMATGEYRSQEAGSRWFSDRPSGWQQLNAIVHPAVIRQGGRISAAGGAVRSRPALAIVEAAILIETGSYRRFDKLIVVVCTPEQQMERAMDRDG